jgi:hypothetical protein
MQTIVFHTIIILYPIIVKCDKDLMCFPLKVYIVESELALAQYIPFATTKIVQYDDHIISSELCCHAISGLDRLKTKILV